MRPASGIEYYVTKMTGNSGFHTRIVIYDYIINMCLYNIHIYDAVYRARMKEAS